MDYVIREGVRRCVAAREAGLIDIPAKILIAGQPDQDARLPLACLYTRRLHVLRDGRYIRDVEYPTLTLGTEPPPIFVVPLRSAILKKYLVPILQIPLV